MLFRSWLRVCPLRKVPRDKSMPVLAVGWESGPAPKCHGDRAEKRQVRRMEQEGTLWEVAQANSRGRSGGPLVDKRGHVVGVATGTNENKGYFCHIDAIHGFLRQNGFTFLFDEVEK